MKTLSKETQGRIENWIYRNGRQLELAQWDHLFHGGRQADVLRAIAVYQNADGGFGHAIEPDSWNPNSTPYNAQHAIRLMSGINFFDLSHPLYQGILRYLDSPDASGPNGFHFTVPSNDQYAHAPWWQYSEETNRTENKGLTAILSGFILRLGTPGTSLYRKAEAFARTLIEDMRTTESFGEMGLAGYSLLLLHISEAGLAAQFDTEGLKARLDAQMNASIERDPAKWAGYTIRPSRYIQSPESPLYAENAAVMEAELDYLIDTLPADDVWPINWSWFDLGSVYPREFSISENWSKALCAIDTMRLLHAFGRLA